MRVSLRFVLFAVVVEVGASPHCKAANFALLEYTGDSQYYTSTPSTNFAIFLDVLPTYTSGLAGTTVSPNGSAKGSFTTSQGSAYGQTYASAAALAAETSPWTLTATQNGATSNYNLYPNFSGLTQASIPSVAVASPGTGGVTYDHRPTFSWTETGVAPTVQVQLINSAVGLNNSYTLPQGQTSWMPPTFLPNGTYTFDVSLTSATVTTPLNATLVSGPDLGLPATVPFFDDAYSRTTFTVVPEPASVAALAALPAAMRRRRRRSDGSSAGR